MKQIFGTMRQLSVFCIFCLLLLSFGASGSFAQSTLLGDVNSDNTIDIVDALLIAQYYVGLNPVGFNSNNADVDASGTPDIVDALLIAQYYVGLIDVFPGQQATPVPTQVSTNAPTPIPTVSGNYSFTGVLTNGYINGTQVEYTTTASFDGSIVTITFSGGSGFEWIWLYNPGFNELTNIGNDIWTLSLSGYSPGDTLQYYFTVRKDGQEANNNSVPHVWVVGTTSTGDTTSPTPTSSTSTSAPTPNPTDPVSGDYTLVWSDEFDNSIGPDWVFETGNGSSGWGNNELEYYRRENAYISNGALVIEAKRENYGGYNYTSARMKTQGRKSWTYGKIEARIDLSLGQGLWPAFWMLGDNITSVNWPACGEIDIMEHINNESKVYGTIHWDDNGYVNYGGSVSTSVTDYHVYAIEWDASSIRWYLDGNQYHEANIANNINSTNEFHNNFFILLNFAVGGNWPGSPDGTTVFPAYMYVDYVRVYQKTSGNITPAPNQTSAPTPGPTPVSGGNWTIVWEDNFDGSGQPDSSNWNYNVGNGYNPGSAVFDGWGNGEWEWYRPDNAYQQNGNLVIRADYNSSATSIQGRNWSQFSARLTTQGKRSWRYGRIEARIAMPSAPGTWPAFWMMGTSCDATYTSNYNPAMSYYDTMASNWSSCGELDIMEHKNNDSVITQNLFWDTRTGVYPWGEGQNASHATENINVGDVTQFHLYSLEWDSNEFRWYVDRESNPNPTKIESITASNQEEFHKPFFIMLNLALSGQFTGPTDPNINDFPLYMYVDYVRVWQQQ
ncbi:MAG: family 16 glycosylhydrolase [Spirochaetales bacterium]|nr:family 16 glycosylhydrolase [Spirochaetales bacterium]